MWAGDEKVSQIEVMLVEVNLIAIVTVNGFLKDPFFPSVILKKNMKQFSEILLFYEILQNNSDLNKKNSSGYTNLWTQTGEEGQFCMCLSFMKGMGINLHTVICVCLCLTHPQSPAYTSVHKHMLENLHCLFVVHVLIKGRWSFPFLE